MRKILIVILLLLLASCGTVKYIEKEVPVETIKTEYINQYYKDSVFIHDSIDRYISGDTVHIYEYKYIYKYLNHTDTILKTDSIPVIIETKTVEVKEVNKLKWYQTALMWLGVILGTVGAYKIIRKLKK